MLLSPQHAQTAAAEGRPLSQTNRLGGINKRLSICVIYITHKQGRTHGGARVSSRTPGRPPGRASDQVESITRRSRRREGPKVKGRVLANNCSKNQECAVGPRVRTGSTLWRLFSVSTIRHCSTPSSFTQIVPSNPLNLIQTE